MENQWLVSNFDCSWVDGTPGGLVTAEIMNWTGHVLRGKRDKIGEIRRRPEARRTGVYILTGDDPQASSGRQAYIGQSDDVAARIQGHQDKEFWDEVTIITSEDSNLTSAHVRYLEARLVQLALAIGRVPLTNGNAPSGGADLPEADASDMDQFIEHMRIVLPMLGLDLFRGRATRVPARANGTEPAPTSTVDHSTEGPRNRGAQDPEAEAPTFILRHRRRGIEARATVIDGEFTVLAGSQAVAEMPDRSDLGPSSAPQYRGRQQLHRRLLQDGSLVEGPSGNAQFTRDVPFNSPSAAGCVVQGVGSINGRTAWVTAEGMTFGDWEERDG